MKLYAQESHTHTLLLKIILVSSSLGCAWLHSYVFKQLRNLWASLGECKAHLPSDSYSKCLLAAQLAAGCRREAPLKYLKWALVYNADEHTCPMTEWEHMEHTRVGISSEYLHASFCISPQLSVLKLNFYWKLHLNYTWVFCHECFILWNSEACIYKMHVHMPCEMNDPLQLFMHCPFYHHVISVGLFFSSIIKKSSLPPIRNRNRCFCFVVRFTFSKHLQKSENNQELRNIVFLKLPKSLLLTVLQETGSGWGF